MTLTFTTDFLLADLQWVLQTIGKRFKFKNFGKLTYCLGLHVGRTAHGTYWISQQRYIEKLSEKFGILPGKKARTPLPAGKNLDEFTQSEKVDPTLYRSLVGTVLYTAVATRIDVAYATSRLAQYSQDPRQIHLEAAYHLIKYLVNTAHYRIHYNGRTETPNSTYIEQGKKGKLTSAYCDASFNTIPATSKSVTGLFVSMYGGAVCWRKINQKIVTTSSGEAEYVALSSACREILYVRQLAEEIGYQEKYPTDLYCDSRAAIQIATNTGFSQRSKSIRLHYHNVRDCVKTNIAVLRKIDGKLNPADALTKPLSRAQTQRYNTHFFDTQTPQQNSLPHQE